MVNNEDNTTNTYNYNEFDINRLRFKKVEETNYSGGQLVSPVTCDNEYNKPYIQTPKIHINMYGIPAFHEQYFNTDDKRMHIKVPLDESDDKIHEFCDFLKSLDEYMESDKVKDILFEKNPLKNKYEYSSIFREMDETDVQIFKQKNPDSEPLPYIKLKVDVKYSDYQNKIYSINTAVFEKDSNNKRNKIDDIKSIDELKSHIRYMSHIRTIITPVKVWAQKKGNGKSPPLYGIMFKMAKVEVEKSNDNMYGNTKKYMQEDTFLDSDEESDIEEFSTTTKQNNVVHSDSDASENDSDASNSESESESESESDSIEFEPVITQPKKSQNKVQQKSSTSKKQSSKTR